MDKNGNLLFEYRQEDPAEGEGQEREERGGERGFQPYFHPFVRIAG